MPIFPTARARRDIEIKSTRSLPQKGSVEGIPDAGWTYLERIEVKSLEQAAKDAQSESGIELRRQLYGSSSSDRKM
jgi:hypothetical protein